MHAAHDPGPEEEVALSDPRIRVSPWVVLIALALGEFMILLDTTIVVVAAPSMAADLRASLDQVLWVLNVYTLLFAVLLITAGRLGDMLSPKTMFMAGLAIFTISSLACGLAQTAPELIAFRATQAIGAASLMPQTLSIVTSIFPREKRGAAFGAWSAIAGLAAVAGPTLGGVLTSTFSWRAVFFPNVPIGVAAIVLAFFIMPDLTARRKRRIDLGGMALATAGLVALVYSLIEGQRHDWGRIEGWLAFDRGPIHGGLVSIPSIFAASAFCIVAFVIFEARQEEPLLPLSLFQERNYRIGNVVAASVNFAILAFYFPLTLFLQSVLGMTALQAGLVVVPNALAIVLAAPASGRLSDRFDGKYVLSGGLILFASGLFLVSRSLSLTATRWTLAVPLVIMGLGMGLTFAPMTSQAMRNILPGAAGAASGFLNTIRQVGAAVGSAVAGAILAGQITGQLKTQARVYAVQLAPQYRPGFLRGISGFSAGGLEVGVGQNQVKLPPGVPAAVAGQLTTLGQTVYDRAFLNAVQPAIEVAIPALLAVAVITLFMRGPRPAAASNRPVGTSPIPAAEPATSPAVTRVAPMNTSGTTMMSVPIPARRRAGGDGAIRAPYLVRVSGDERYTLQRRPLLIGRRSNSDISLDSPKVSRQHALIGRQGGRFVLRDLGSSNGTYVNGERVVGARDLHDGDGIGVGDDAFVFHNDVERVHPRLVALSGDQVEYPITGRMTVGRAAGNDIVIEEPRTSRYHAEITCENGAVVVRDLETLNGTFVNGRAAEGEAALSPGDVVVFGATSFVYQHDLEGEWADGLLAGAGGEGASVVAAAGEP